MKWAAPHCTLVYLSRSLFRTFRKCNRSSFVSFYWRRLLCFRITRLIMSRVRDIIAHKYEWTETHTQRYLNISFYYSTEGRPEIILFVCKIHAFITGELPSGWGSVGIKIIVISWNRDSPYPYHSCCCERWPTLHCLESPTRQPPQSPLTQPLAHEVDFIYFWGTRRNIAMPWHSPIIILLLCALSPNDMIKLKYQRNRRRSWN